MIKLRIKDNIIEISNNITYFNSWTEYVLKKEHIKTKKNEELPESELELETLLLMPNTHINNLWHFLHNVFLTFKFIKRNNLSIDNLYFIFFRDNFYNRQGNILEGQYRDILFKGLDLNMNNFEKIHNEFQNNKSISVKNLLCVDESLNFNNEPMFELFKETILKNFDIKRDSKKRNITFILRKGTREIKNIEYVKENLNNTINYVYMEDYSNEEQLRLIVNTDILIGLHGAGLTWCVFMKNNSQLIELYPGNSNTDNYIRWCKIANIKYNRLCVDIISGSVGNFRNANVSINMDQLKQIKEYL